MEGVRFETAEAEAVKKDKPKFKGRRKTVYENKEGMQKLGVQDDPLYQLFQDLSRSPLQNGKVAKRFTKKLERKLGNLEWNRAIHGDKVTVPQFDSETSVLVGHVAACGTPVRIPFKELKTDVVLCGAPGSGKTTAASHFINTLAGQVPIIFLDHKTEGLRFMKKIPDAVYMPIEKQRWNCLSGATNQKAYIRYLSSQVTRLMALLPVTANAVQAKLIALCSNPDNLPAFSDFPDVFSNLARKGLRSSLHTASRNFDDLAVAMGDWGKVRQGKWPFDEHMLSVVPLKDCPTAFEHFYISLLFKHLTDAATGAGQTDALRRIVIFDEGRGFFGKEMETASASGRVNLQSEILTKTRSYGIGNIIGSQSIVSLQAAVVDNAGTFMAFRTNSEQEAKACCRRLGLEESRYVELLQMDVGTVWMVSPSCRNPIKVRISFNDLGEYPREAEIIRMMEPIWATWNANTVFAPARDTDLEEIDFMNVLGEKDPEENVEIEPPEKSQSVPESVSEKDPLIIAEYLAFLRSCKDNPNLSVSDHYRLLGWSAGRGTRVKKSLEELNWIESISLKTSKAGRPSMRLRPTTVGLEVLHESK